MKVLFSWTSILHFSGDFVHLDGTNGAIHRLEQEEEQQQQGGGAAGGGAAGGGAALTKLCHYCCIDVLHCDMFI